MRVTLSRGWLAILVIAVLAAVALILGIVAPPDERRAGASAAQDSTLLVSEFSDSRSTLWLIDPDRAGDLSARTQFLSVEHARGWDVNGKVAPDGERLAFLALEPGRTEPSTEAALFVSDGGAGRRLAGGLDLRAGLAWSSDGKTVFVRRTILDANGGRRFAIDAVDAAGGSHHSVLQRDDVLGLYPVGAAGGVTYVVAIDRNGSALLGLARGDETRSRHLSPGVTRDWTLSPDGTQLAFTEQQGLDLQVHTIDLDGGGAAAAALAGAADLRAAAATSDGGSASPAWHPSGDLSMGTFGEEGAPMLRVAADGDSSVAAQPADGFALPVAWSGNGDHLAVRAFSGTGPEDPGEERAGVVTDKGGVVHLPGTQLRILGWWDGG